MQQPDVGNLLQSMGHINAGVTGITHELSLVPNIPAVGDGAQLNQILQNIQNDVNTLNTAVTNLTNLVQQHHTTAQANHTTLQANFATLQANFNANHNVLLTIQTYIADSPMKVANAAAGISRHLRGTNGLIPVEFVHTRDALVRATVGEANALAAHLERHDYPVYATVKEKRQFLADYLGCFI